MGKRIGFVPTMGALHAGHISLVKASISQNDITVSSIFINPTQFNDPGDFAKYPVTLETDLFMLEEAGTDILFLPSVKDMYPEGISTLRKYDLGRLEQIFEGKYRPGHFQGVCNVVDTLLSITEPDHLYLGQKDYQQSMVLTRLLEIIGRKQKTKIVVCPTFREPDGLAMSSRNLRLKEDERKKAVTISKVLEYLKNNLKPGSLKEMKSTGINKLKENGLKPDYVAIADANTLDAVENWDGKQRLVALIAAYLNDVRLIDNMLLN